MGPTNLQCMHAVYPPLPCTTYRDVVLLPELAPDAAHVARAQAAGEAGVEAVRLVGSPVNGLKRARTGAHGAAQEPAACNEQ